MQDFLRRLNKLKQEKNAIIVAHIYQLPEIQDIADFVGDSLELSRKASQTDADIIVFCGVHFMAETAKILSPQKKVLLPDLNAGCPMADMINESKLQELKALHPKAKVVAYVNTSASIKAQSDICCTSANAVNVVKSLKDEEIIFVPDRNLGAFVASQSGKDLILYNGFCPTHNNFILPEFAIAARAAHPNAIMLVHPECRPETIALADYAMSTGQMCKFVEQSPHGDFIIGTELGIFHKLKKDNPQKNFYPINSLAVCPNMKKITLAKVLDALETEKNIVEVGAEIAARAYQPIQKMLEL
ncbi:MAG: quinolinate synthase NadA [Elusimicrobiota bacterium]|nr:quinolinate synthase NadA [Elusimicrobiota bacterium]